MNAFAPIFRALQAAIAARAARDRGLTVILVALWGRIARRGSRLDRLITLWRTGKLPKKRACRGRRDRMRRDAAQSQFPRAPAWLVGTLGYEVAVFGGQLTHAMDDAECAAFLAACPQAGRVLRPMLRMLGVAPLPAVLGAPVAQVRSAAVVAERARRRTEKRRAARADVWPAQGLPQWPKGAWLAPRGRNWGSGG